MAENKKLKKVVYDMAKTLKEVPEDLPPPWDMERKKFIKDFNEMVGILADLGLLNRVPPWCPDIIPFFPAP